MSPAERTEKEMLSSATGRLIMGMLWVCNFCTNKSPLTWSQGKSCGNLVSKIFESYRICGALLNSHFFFRQAEYMQDTVNSTNWCPSFLLASHGAL